MSPTQSPKSVLILGAGVIGLQNALTLLQAGYRVSVVAARWPGDEADDPEGAEGVWASPWAGAHWRTQASGPDEDQAKWDLETYDYVMNLPEAEQKAMGIELHPSHQYFAHPSNTPNPPWWTTHVHSASAIPSSSLPPGAAHGTTFQTYTLHAPTYIAHLLSRIKTLGAQIHRADLPSPLPAALDRADEVAGLAREDVLVTVNALGLGARDVVGDEGMVAARGQSVVVRGQASAVRTWNGRETYAVIPWGGGRGTFLGGLREVGVCNTSVVPAITMQILAPCKVLAPELLNERGEFDVVREQVGLRPQRAGGARVEVERLGEDVVLHCYGHGGAGYQNSVGCARRVLRMVAGLEGQGQAGW